MDGIDKLYQAKLRKIEERFVEHKSQFYEACEVYEKELKQVCVKAIGEEAFQEILNSRKKDRSQSDSSIVLVINRSQNDSDGVLENDHSQRDSTISTTHEESSGEQDDKKDPLKSMEKEEISAEKKEEISAEKKEDTDTHTHYIHHKEEGCENCVIVRTRKRK
ncbi:hypothetical protein CDAR_622491 [Caerostris darwini]|uniref:Uncharacterized protein n=1 Tax=Caerostris darwini TaxID=1538125 RepID=A0AAV4W9R6_9ARAC|nr:hypothetical protein CDAR_622491 [Caerostris darwini]